MFGPIPIAGAGPHRPTVRPVLAASRDWYVRAARTMGKSGKNPERLFSLVRLKGGGGDWLLPDNNEKTLWRLQLHDEETTGGTVRR
jgi:hypothetical protein